MSNYILNSSGKRNIVSLSLSKKYVFESNNKKVTKYKNITVYDEDKINNILIKKINKKLGYLVYLMETTSDSDSNFEIFLGEIDKLESMIMYKYQEFLKREAYEDFLNKLEFIRKSLSINQYEEEKSIGR